MCFGQFKHGIAFGNVFLGPCNKLGLLSLGLKEFMQPFLGFWTGLDVEDVGDLGGDEELAPVGLGFR